MRLQLFVFCLLCVAIFSSCKTRNRNEFYMNLEESIRNSNSTLGRCTFSTLEDLNSKQSEPVTHYKASIWYPKAKKITEITGDMFEYIEDLKNPTGKKDGSMIKINRIASNDLLLRLYRYRDSILNVDTLITECFKENMFLFTKRFDSLQNRESAFYHSFFEENNMNEDRLMLNKFQNNIRLLENRIVGFCTEQISTGCGWYDTYSAIIGQNKAQLLPGQFIEITAGVGAFSVAAKPEISIKKLPQQIGEDGAAHYKAKVPSTPGNYSIPVEISFTDGFGMPQTISKSIEYKVVKPQ